MTGTEWFVSALYIAALPLGLGLLGFVEPCSIGSSMLFIKHLEGRSAGDQSRQLLAFTVARAALLGLMGVAAVALGAGFASVQKAAWLLLGAAYVVIGVLYAVGRARLLMVAIGPGIARLSDTRGSVALGFVFGLNIPACAAPLLLALLGAAAAGGATGRTAVSGFTSLALFGLALSLPLIAAVRYAPARAALGRLTGLSVRLPLMTGMLLVGVGVWNVVLTLRSS